MRVRVRLFAQLRERAGRDELWLDLPEGARVSDALAEVSELAAGLPLVLAVNRDYAKPDRALATGDELALVPPVSGGAAVSALLTAEPIDEAAVRAAVSDPRAGAVVVFSGVTRDVEALEYEAYAEMARPRLEAIAAEARARHGLCAVAVAHRTGRVTLSEPSVVVAVSAPHRAEAFAGAREVIDRVKAEAPIWKREPDGWVKGTVPTTS